MFDLKSEIKNKYPIKNFNKSNVNNANNMRKVDLV